MLVGPEFASGWVHGKALDIAMSSAEDLGRTGAAVGHTNDAARMVACLLGTVFLPSVAKSQVEMTLLVDHQPAAEVSATSGLRLHSKENLHVLEGVSIEAGPGHGGAGRGHAARQVALRIREEQNAILSMIGVGKDIKESTLAAGNDVRGESLNGLGIEPEVFRDPPKPTAALGDQKVAIG
jgi:hypothetical protein